MGSLLCANPEPTRTLSSFLAKWVVFYPYLSLTSEPHAGHISRRGRIAGAVICDPEKSAFAVSCDPEKSAFEFTRGAIGAQDSTPERFSVS